MAAIMLDRSNRHTSGSVVKLFDEKQPFIAITINIARVSTYTG